MKRKWEDFELTGQCCPLCGNPTRMTPYDCGHKEEECRECWISGDAIFEFARKVKQKYEVKP